jgi:hypothetical protein
MRQQWKESMDTRIGRILEAHVVLMPSRNTSEATYAMLKTQMRLEPLLKVFSTQQFYGKEIESNASNQQQLWNARYVCRREKN